MYYFPAYLGIIFTLFNAVTPDPHKLTAVSNYRIAEVLYRRIRDKVPDVPPPPDLDPNTKNRICHHITGSSYFRNDFNQEQVNMIQVGPKLRKTIPDLYELLYSPSSDQTSRNDRYTNYTKMVDVYVSELDKETIQENVFICLTFDYEEDEEKFFIYHVSDEYNLSDDTSKSYLAGRFVFVFSDRFEKDLDIFILAEVPARSLSNPGREVELAYLQRRARNTPAQNQSDDPICTLSRSARLRVCTLVLSSKYFENELEFTPEFENVDRSFCERRVITFQDAECASEAGRKSYSEWMIACRPDEYYADYQEEYYVSRVYNSDTEVFVYRQGQNSSIILENLFGDVRFKV